MPVLEEVADSADGVEFFVGNSCGGLFEGAGEKVEVMEESIFVRDGWMRKVVVAEFNSVGDEEGFSGGVDDLEAAVVLQGEADVEAVAGAEVPGGAGRCLVMNEYATSDGSKEGGIAVEGAMEVFPSEKEGSDGGLAEKVEGEFGLREEFVP